MAKTQFFTRKDDNLEEYKINFTQTLQKVKTVKLFSEEVIAFLEQWIDSQTNYIPREDIDNFGVHLDRIFKERTFYDFIVVELAQVKGNGKIQEYGFNLISQLHDSAKLFEKSEKKRKAFEVLENSKNQSREEDEAEMQKILEEL